MSTRSAARPSQPNMRGDSTVKRWSVIEVEPKRRCRYVVESAADAQSRKAELVAAGCVVTVKGPWLPQL